MLGGYLQTGHSYGVTPAGTHRREAYGVRPRVVLDILDVQEILSEFFFSDEVG